MRWTAVTAVLAVALATVVGVAGESGSRPNPRSDAAEQRLIQAFARVRQTEGNLHRVTLRDSLRAALRGRDWPAESLLVVIDPHVPAWRGALETARARTLWAAAGPMKGGVRVAYVAVVSEFGRERGSTTLLPDAFDGHTCVAVRELNRYSISKDAQHHEAGDTSLAPPIDSATGVPTFSRSRWQEGDILGPCAFFAAFGQPGPKIRAWLDDVDFMHAASANFWSPAAVMPRWYKSMWDGVEQAAFRDRVAAYMDRMLGYPSGRTNVAVIRCASGQANECPDVVMAGSLPPDQEREPIERGLPQPRHWYYEFGYVGDRSYRDFRPRLLADMVRDVGVDRFRKIWTSQRKINEAYAEATGTPFETAMADYVRRSVGGGASLGPSLPARPAVSAMLIVLALLIGVAGRVARREHR